MNQKNASPRISSRFPPSEKRMIFRRLVWSVLLLGSGVAVPVSVYSDDSKAMAGTILSSVSLSSDGESKNERPFQATAFALAERRFFLVDRHSNQIKIYDREGALLRTFGDKGLNREVFEHPEALCADGAGRVFVADTGHHRIVVFNEEGRFLAEFGRKGSRPGQLRSPVSIAAGADGRVYVADTGNDRVQIFSREGIFLSAFGSREGLRAPFRLRVDSSDSVYVADARHRVLKFDPRGRLVQSYKLPAEDFIVDPFGAILYLDAESRRIRYTPSGGEKDPAAGAFLGPENSKDGDWLGIEGGAENSFWRYNAANTSMVRFAYVSDGKPFLSEENRAPKIILSGPLRIWPALAEGIAQAGEMIYAYLPEKKEIAAIDRAGNFRYRFKFPFGHSLLGHPTIGATPADGVFVAASSLNRIYHFDLRGNSIPFAPGPGLPKGLPCLDISSPQGLALGSNGVLYVASRRLRRVEAFGKDGKLLFSIGPRVGAFQLRDPIAVAGEASGSIYVLDRGLKRIFSFNSKGEFLSAFGGVPEDAPFIKPSALAAGSGLVFLLDRGDMRIKVFTKEGLWLGSFFAPGGGEENLKAPSSLAFQGLELLISDPGARRIASYAVRWIASPPKDVAGSAGGGTVSLRWSPSPEGWESRYLVFRSTSLPGPYDLAGASENSEFIDRGPFCVERYFYRIAADSLSGDLGPGSIPIQVNIHGAHSGE